MKITYKGNKRISSKATQKEIINYLNCQYGISKKILLNTIQKERKDKNLVFSILSCNRVIIIYLEPGKMFTGSIPAEC